ncbi:MAG: hypothetical protein KC457_37125, partial [Myxococcales bacterium]|nr:hypothetical protein [Myxococcales bacterium]
VVLTLLIAACQPGDEQNDESLRDVYFDGAEIKAQLAEDPDAIFFADLRDGNILHFDQSEEAIDFSHFIFQCPSMPAPVAMEGFMIGMDSDLLLRDYWSMKSMADLDSEFRLIPFCDGVLYCPNGPKDCVCIEP